MENLDKIRPPVFSFPVSCRKPFGDAVYPFRRFIPFVFKTILAALLLSGFQLFLIGAADRLGISPKWSVIVSCLFLSAVGGFLAVCGGGLKVKVSENECLFENELTKVQIAEPLCKILMIRRK